MKSLDTFVVRYQRALSQFFNAMLADAMSTALENVPKDAAKATRKVAKATRRVAKAARPAPKPRLVKPDDAPQATNSHLDTVRDFLKGRDPLPLKDIAAGCNLDPEQARSILNSLRDSKVVKTQGVRRGMKYLLAG